MDNTPIGCNGPQCSREIQLETRCLNFDELVDALYFQGWVEDPNQAYAFLCDRCALLAWEKDEECRS
jgi:hypothetical protein